MHTKTDLSSFYSSYHDENVTNHEGNNFFLVNDKTRASDD